ncbi:MAG TPA: insulinase family protein [Nitrospirae bacterium]|nr:insulinase family protein [Nitrospirota bacterium]HDZ87244.1 insulinase family protein [Nitrospirota bacterium]
MKDLKIPLYPSLPGGNHKVVFQTAPFYSKNGQGKGGRRIFCNAFFVILFIFFLSVFPPPLCAEVREYHLDNGLKILVAEDHKAPIATFQVWYRVGSMDDPSGEKGISHLLEHMMFKGTPKYGSKVFSRIIQKNGGQDNAYTTRDYTAYFETLSSDRLDIPINFEADRMRNLLLDPASLKSEEKVVMEERRLRNEDDPRSSLFEEVMAAAFKAHPYQYPVIGWMSDIKSVSHDEISKYYRAYYSPDNAFIVVTGDVEPGQIYKNIKRAFGDIPVGKGRSEINTVEPVQRGEKRIFLEMEAKLPYVLIAYHTPVFPDDDSYALDVLESILSGKSGRLYRNVVHNSDAVLDAFAEYMEMYVDPMLFLLGGTAAPGNDPGRVEKALYGQIDLLKKEAPADREVQKAKNQVEASFIMQQDSLYMQARVIGMFEILGGWRLKDKYLEGIRNVTPEDVRRVAKKYFTRENRTVGILIPK